MSTDRAGHPTSDGSWTVLASHDWEETHGLDTSLSTALYELEGVDETSVLYDYVDTEAVSEALGFHSESWGASEIRFQCERYEIRITNDGTIAAR